MKKITGNYTADAVKALRASDKLHCQTTENGEIYVCNGYFVFCMTPEEYTAIVQPVTHCDAGNWAYANGTRTDGGSIDAATVYTNAVKAADNAAALERCPLDLDAGKARARCYYNPAADFAAFYNAQFIAALHPDAVLRSTGAVAPAVAYTNSEPFAVVLPLRPEPKTARAVRAYFVESESSNELFQAQNEIAQAQNEIAQLRNELAQAQNALAQQAQPATTKPAAVEVAARFADLPGVTTTIKGAQTAAPVIWLSGDTEQHAEAIKAAGGKWSNKRSAFYVCVA